MYGAYPFGEPTYGQAPAVTAVPREPSLFDACGSYVASLDGGGSYLTAVDAAASYVPVLDHGGSTTGD